MFYYYIFLSKLEKEQVLKPNDSKNVCQMYASNFAMFFFTHCRMFQHKDETELRTTCDTTQP